MSTARSSTEGSGPVLWRDLRGSVADLRSMLRFRGSALDARQQRRMRIGGLVVLGLSIASVVVPAYLRGPLHGRHAGQLVAVLPSLYLGFLFLSVVSSVASGGGREMIPREQAVAFPVSTWSEHFGALLLAPLNIAWLLQGWTLLACTSYVVGPHNLWAGALPVLVWVLGATSLGQGLGWVVEGIRRGRYGAWVMRGITAAAVVVVSVIVLTHKVTPLLDRSPTVRLFLLVLEGVGGAWGSYALGLGVLMAGTAAIVLLGGVPARWALHRPQRDEARLDSGMHSPRPNPASDLVAMVRIDRAGVWRSVPLRRGIVVLAFMPGLIATAGALRWDLITILPGLVASGGGLLFGVNAWCLDGRGALWRDSLPVSQGLVFLAKVIVLFELLAAAAATTIVLSAFRAGRPTATELAATLCAALVVATSVTSAAMRWSVRRPFAVDMRSARATPAPPVVMVGYSARLALATTSIGMLFSLLAFSDDWRIPVVIAIPFLAVSTLRILHSADRWRDPVVRSRVVATVAG